jgi:hypothetical protein
MRRFLLLAALPLVACNTPRSDSNANADANGNHAALPSAASNRMAPSDGYRSYFAQRWTAGEPVTPTEVRALIASQGAQRAVATLYGDGQRRRWDTVSHGIATGNAAWLELAPLIAPGTDAGTSLDFGLAMSDALTTNAAGALRAIQRMPATAIGACEDSSIEPTPEQVRAFYAAAIASVEAVSDPALQALKAQCLASLRAGAAR